jgi:hypothetical protein
MKRRLFKLTAAISFGIFILGVSALPVFAWLPFYGSKLGIEQRWFRVYGEIGDGFHFEMGRPIRPSENSKMLRFRRFPLGFMWHEESGEFHGRRSESWIECIVIPYWFFAVTTLPLPLIWTRRRRRENLLRRRGQCPTCGYDLRATPDRCPECGTKASGESVGI